MKQRARAAAPSPADDGACGSCGGAYGAALAAVRELLSGTGKWHGMPELLDTLDRLRRGGEPAQQSLAVTTSPGRRPAGPSVSPGLPNAEARGRERHVDVMVDA